VEPRETVDENECDEIDVVLDLTRGMRDAHLQRDETATDE
jgi:hypothetical protein